MANMFNQAEEVIFGAQHNQQPLSTKDRILIEALLQDSGVLPAAAVGGGGQSPPTSPSPPSPGPPPPSPAPAPAPATPSNNPILRLAMTTVKPGDLITASFMNSLVEALFALDDRLKKLEAPSSAPASPPPPPPPPSPPAPQQGGGGSFEAEAPAAFEAEAVHSSTGLEPVIESAVATRTKGTGLRIDVTGDNILEGMVEEVRLGKTKIAVSKVGFDAAGLHFPTTRAALEGAKNRLTIVTMAGKDSATVTTAGPAPAR